jgi:hypothetical protein
MPLFYNVNILITYLNPVPGNPSKGYNITWHNFK